MTSEPLRLTFEVACPAQHAFTVWTTGIAAWWPRDHTVTAQTGSVVVLEPHRGGRIYERTPSGEEHDWGEVTVWEPPHRLGYLWHLRQDRDDATDVDIRVVPLGSSTRVDIEHRGWERLGTRGAPLRERNLAGWTSLLPHYRSAIERTS